MNVKSLSQNKIGQATVIIAVFSLLAKILGLVRDAVFSHQFGTGPLMDSYFAAFRVPDFIYNLLILGTFSVAFIPVFSEYLLKDKEESNQLASSIINVTLLMMLALTGLAFVFIVPLTHAIAPGFSGNSFETTKIFTKIFLFSPLFLTLSSIVSSMLNTHKRFLMVAVAPVVYNLSIIAGAVWFYPRWGLQGLAWAVVLGAALHFLVQVPQILQLGFHYSPQIIASPGFTKFWRLYWPRIFSMGTEQVTSVIVTIFGSFLGAGALAAFYYANNLQSVFLGMFAVSFSIAVFPLLSDLYNQDKQQTFRDVFAKTCVQILFFIIPLSILTLVLRAQIVRVVLGAGAATHFNFNDTKIVAESLGLFAISLFAQGLIPLFTRAFYAMHNTLTPVVIGFVTIASNIAVTYFLTNRLGVAGMALAYSITNILHLTILIMILHRRLGSLHDEYLAINTLKIVIAALLGGVLAYLCLYFVAPWVDMHTYWGVLTQGVIAGAAGILGYLLFGFMLRLSETHDLVKLLRSALTKAIRVISPY